MKENSEATILVQPVQPNARARARGYNPPPFAALAIIDNDCIALKYGATREEAISEARDVVRRLGRSDVTIRHSDIAILDGGFVE